MLGAMIFLDDTETYVAAGSRREMVDALLEHLADEPELWQVQAIAAACLGRREVMDVSVLEM